MAAWYEGSVASNGINLQYARTGGDKAAMLLVHGITQNRLTWTRLARALQPTYDMILIDARGHGLSDKPARGYSPRDHMQDLVGAIQALKLEKPIVIGHSMGGDIASWLAAEYPELVSALILEEPSWTWPRDAAQLEERNRTGYEDSRKRLAYQKSLSSAEGYAYWLRELPRFFAEDLEAAIQGKEQVAMQALDWILEREPVWPQQVSKFVCPVLLIYGDPALKGMVGPDIAGEAKRLNELVEPRQIPGVGHFTHMEKFDEYLAYVREFLARVRREAAQAVAPIELQHE